MSKRPFQAEDEAEYEEAVRELSSGVLRQGLWGKALVEANGDQEKAKALYLKMRVVLIKEEKKAAGKTLARRGKVLAEEKREKDRLAGVAARDKKCREAEAEALAAKAARVDFLRAFPQARRFEEDTVDALARRHASGENVVRDVYFYKKYSWIHKTVFVVTLIIGIVIGFEIATRQYLLDKINPSLVLGVVLFLAIVLAFVIAMIVEVYLWKKLRGAGSQNAGKDT